MTWPNDIVLIAGNGPLRFWCRLFGHKWRTFDANWCGKDYQMCQRIGLCRSSICAAEAHMLPVPPFNHPTQEGSDAHNSDVRLV